MSHRRLKLSGELTRSAEGLEAHRMAASVGTWGTMAAMTLSRSASAAVLGAWGLWPCWDPREFWRCAEASRRRRSSSAM